MQEELSKKGDLTTCPFVVITKDDKILLGHRHYKKDEWKEISVWTIPGGRCNDGENVEEALRREVFEEIGVENLNIEKFLGEVAGVKEGDKVLIFTGTTSENPKLMEPENFSEWSWLEPSNIPPDFINEKVKELILNSVATPFPPSQL